jgi:hypothetical protein
MTQSVETSALFDLDNDGQLVLPADHVEQQPVGLEEEWGVKLSPTDRAFIELVPNSVAVADRAGHLVRSLTEISEANSRRGFVHAAQTEAHRPKIEDRYGPHTDGMAEGAEYNALTGERRARYEFFAASGVGRLALTNRLPVPADEAETANPADLAYMAMNRSWREFQALYGGTGPAVNARRNAYKKMLAKQVEYTREGTDN